MCQIVSLFSIYERINYNEKVLIIITEKRRRYVPVSKRKHEEVNSV